MAVRLNLHALVTRATLKSGWDSREEFVCAKGRDSKRTVSSLVLIFCEALLPICVLLGSLAGGSFLRINIEWVGRMPPFLSNGLWKWKFLDHVNRNQINQAGLNFTYEQA